ncbi:MAG: elongation factor G [Planctomycetes bacterium]|nr:elongation factor G [Planctomycetota bacterium]HON43982.1 elongation factor G [Planctomycetota bacterium]HPY75519.1 elongation factor G [Planctomycetota bacterium]HQB01132.1 elongation factor G [Planctomycetota bacterium]HRU52405.1 elongation factor G [Planctomycetota bacterium]
MSKYETSAIRNIALVGHGSTGKTTLCEVFLKEVGLISRVPAGKIDFAEDEKAKQYSIDSAIAHITWKDKEFNIIDVPGSQEFYQNVISCLSVVETGIIVIAATDGITINTKRAWKIAQQNKLAKIIVMTKVDGENVNFEERIEEIQKEFGSHCVPFAVPDASGVNFSKISMILDNDNAYKEKLLEAVVETDEALMEEYFAEGTISDEAFRTQLKIAVKHGDIIPIIPVNSLKDIGIKELMDFLAEYAPSPADVAPKKGMAGEEEISYPATEDAPFTAKVFKIFNDPFGRLTYFRVYSGTVASNSNVYDVNIGASEGVGKLNFAVGKDLIGIEKAIPGDIVVMAKVENVQIGHTLSVDKSTFQYPMEEYPVPMVSFAVTPKSRGDEQKISGALAKLAEEDKTFIVQRDEETAEQIISGMSQLHLEIMINRLKTRYKVECNKTLPKIPYRETIMGKADERYRHKKQSGGHGQFAEVAIKIEPNERGEGFEFIDQIVGGVISSQFVASTQKGIQTTLTKGILAGCPIVDVKVSVWDGKMHDVDSSDAAFQLAGSKAFQEGFMKAKPVLLEPIMEIEITIPERSMGDIMGDLNSRRGRIQGTESEASESIVKALIPLSEIQTYSTELKSITGGEGNYSIKFSHYDVVPGNIQEKIIARYKEEQEKA